MRAWRDGALEAGGSAGSSSAGFRPAGRRSARGGSRPASARVARVAVDPLGIVRGEDVRLDAERRQVLRELERALHAAAAGGREVHRHEQHLHGREG